MSSGEARIKELRNRLECLENYNWLYTDKEANREYNEIKALLAEKEGGEHGEDS